MCYRQDDYKPYKLDNLRLVTWKENLDKCNQDKRNGINNKLSKSVIRMDKNENFIERITELKKTSKKNITLLGSGKILKQLANANLVDEYQIMMDPIFIVKGEPILDNLNNNINLELTKSKVFKSGTSLLYYKPKAN